MQGGPVCQFLVFFLYIYWRWAPYNFLSSAVLGIEEL